MPDAFFQKKRKRTASSSSSSSAPARASSRAGPSRSKLNSSSRMRKGRNAASASDNDDDDDDVPGGGIDDMDLTHRYDEGPNTDDEADAAETPAEARVRLAKMYLQGLSSSSSAPRPSGAHADAEDDFFESDQTASFGLADAAQADRDNIAARLQKDVAEQSGRLHLFIAHRIAPPVSVSVSDCDTDDAGVDYSNSMLAVRGHRLSVTSAVASSDAKWLFTASKDGSVIRWRLRDGKMMRILPRRAKHLDENGDAVAPSAAGKSKSSGAARRRARLSAKAKSKHSSHTPSYISVGEDQGHTDEVWTLSLSSDGKYLASGGKDKRVCIWSVSSSSADKFVKTLGGHKDSISAVCFRTGSHELYTASLDRTLKLYDVAQLSYIETLFGHQESVLSLSCLSAETAVSAGGRDRTCRYWKIRDESQLVFRAGIRSKLRSVLEGGDLAAALDPSEGKMSNPTEAMEGSVEVVAMIDSHHFVSGGDSGTISLWNLGKKKPVFSMPVAHGFHTTCSHTEGNIHTPRWITSLAALAYSDVFVSGSWDGSIKVWSVSMGGGQVKSFQHLFNLAVDGVVNSLQIISPPISSCITTPSGHIRSKAVNPSEWKRASGLKSQSTTPNAEEMEGDKLKKLHTSKENSPPIIIAAVGKEHKFGRWIMNRTAKNGTLIIALQLSPATTATDNANLNTCTMRRGDRFKLV